LSSKTGKAWAVKRRYSMSFSNISTAEAGEAGVNQVKQQ
jgi:hypothetical protein